MIVTDVQRLRSPADIRAAMRSRVSGVGRLLVVHVHDREDADPTRVAVVASRRVGSAVRRNRAKRLLREAARAWSWPAGRDVVLVARGPLATARLADALDDLATALERAGLVTGRR